ncbi:MAG: DNA-binding response regulator [Saprospirales bacterium]|nr:MAG: DNA-binding response regulator [Saprospirales bacterium]
MEKINAIIIDDEVACTESLKIELEMYCPQIEVMAVCNTAEEGLSKIVSLKPDLVFLDIEMPWMNGFELLRQLNQINFEVIFITAYDQFALKAFEFSAVDYLLKPIKKEDLISAVQKVEQRRTKLLSTEHIEAMLSNMNFLTKDFSSIAVPTGEGLEFIPVDEIIYCEADNNYTYIHKSGGDSLLLSKTLKEVEGMLSNHSFFRIHQSFLINMKHLRKYVRGQGGYVVMSNKKDLPVARSKKDGLMSSFNG